MDPLFQAPLIDIELTPFRQGDGQGLTALYQSSVLELGPRHYSRDQVQAWASLTPTPDVFELQAADGRWRRLAWNATGECLAFADLEADGRIDFFYCAPKAAGQGVSAQLYTALEGQALDMGLGRLYMEASEGARGFFLRRGFRLLCRRDFQVAGVWIHNYAMEKAVR
ncbi:GNAT family N-acetyltransferase [Fodinicurvata fenggangensis]|uniref:GNAT family N-acetyltransferase n=1 Tax=Fodinicurvata fenggangensis TaxID=1121830 RepID=UPI00054DB3F0|nr:GNAT family N-acetyltransferase [Fodinicurvata fenggangensis]